MVLATTRPVRPLQEEPLRRACGGGVAAAQVLKLAKDPPPGLQKGSGRWLGNGTGQGLDGRDWQWNEALLQTQERERALRAAEEQEREQQRKKAEAEAEAARLQELERKKQADLRQQRVEALIAQKAEQRRKVLEKAEEQKVVQEQAFSSEVAGRKDREREIRAMAWEEEAMRKEVAFRTATAEMLEHRAIAEQMARDLQASEAARAQQEQEECAAAEAASRQADMQAAERVSMMAAEVASRSVQNAAEEAAWAESVRRSREQLVQDRATAAEEEQAARRVAAECETQKCLEDTARLSAAVVDEAMQSAAADFAKIVAKSEARAAAAELQHLMQRLVEERSCLEEEERLSRLRETHDAEQAAQEDWHKAVATRKASEQQMRVKEAAESQAMSREDTAARERRLIEQRSEAQRLDRLRRHTDEACHVYTMKLLHRIINRHEINKQRKMQVVQEFLQAAEVAQAEMAAKKEAIQREEHIRRKYLEEAAEAKRLAADREAMQKADLHSFELRRGEQRNHRHRVQMEREFRVMKAQHLERKYNEDAAAVQRQVEYAKIMLKQAAEADHETNFRSFETQARQQAELAESQRRAAEIASKERKESLAEARRRENILAAEARSFEELYRQNRSLVSEARRHEETQATAESTSYSCMQPAAEMAGLSASGGGGMLGSDRTLSETKVAAEEVSPVNMGAGRLMHTAGELLAFAQSISTDPSLSEPLESSGTFFTS